MYQLVSALVRSSQAGSRWESVDIGPMTLASLYGNYEKVYAVLTNPFYTGQKTLDLDAISSSHGSPANTFNQFLTALGDTALPMLDYTYSVKTAYAHYSDGWRANYKVQPISPLGHVDGSILMADRDWLSITRAATDINQLFKSALVTINGFIHRTDSDGQMLYVIDGMKSCRVSNDNNWGITSFNGVGELEFMNITPEMIHKRYADTPYKSRMYIDIGTARPGKTAMLVLGGYLHVLDNDTFNRVSDTVYAINFQNFPLRDRYFDSFKNIDLSVLGLDHQPSNPVRIDDGELHSDAVLVKYATLSQSFLVFIDKDYLFVEHEHLPRDRLRNTYISHIEPKYPLITTAGKISDYWPTEEDKKWGLTMRDSIRQNYDYNTTLEENIVCIDNARTPSKPTTPSLAYFLKVGTETLIQSGATP